MSWQVANVRLELVEPEQALPEKLADRLGLARDGIAHYRILRKSLDARRHDDLHFVYAAEVEVPGDGASIRREGGGIEPFVPEVFDWPEPGREPLEHRPVIVGAGPAGLFAGFLLAKDGYRPLDPGTGAGTSRTGSPTSAGSTPAACSTPRATTCSARGGPGPSPTAS